MNQKLNSQTVIHLSGVQYINCTIVDDSEYDITVRLYFIHITAYDSKKSCSVKAPSHVNMSWYNLKYVMWPLMLLCFHLPIVFVYCNYMCNPSFYDVFVEALSLCHQRSFPYISAMVNNGSVSYDHGKDGRSSELGGCSAEIRNRDHDTYLAIRYSKGRLTVWRDSP